MTHGAEKNVYLLGDEEQAALTNAVKFQFDMLMSAHNHRGVYSAEQMLSEAANAVADLYELNHDGGGWTKISVNMGVAADQYRDAMELDAECNHLNNEDLPVITHILEVLNQ